MTGIVVIPAVLLYLLLCVVVVLLTVRYARKSGRSAKLWGWGAALVMYLIPFWDWLPTVATHQYYCAKDAGFWVYKTVDQWKEENPGVMETLVDNSPSESYPNWPTEAWSGKEITSINQRFGMLYKNHLTSPEEGELFLHVWRWQNDLVDKKTGEVLVRRVDYSSGNGHIGGEPPMKFWLQSDHCMDSNERAGGFGELLKQFRGAKR